MRRTIFAFSSIFAMTLFAGCPTGGNNEQVNVDGKADSNDANESDSPIVQPNIEVAIVEPMANLEQPAPGITFAGGFRAALATGDKPSSVSWSPDGKWLATADENAKLWDVATGKVARDFGAASFAAFQPSGDLLLAREKGLAIVNVANGNQKKFLPHAARFGGFEPKNVRVSNNGKVVLCIVSYDAVLFELETGTSTKLKLADESKSIKSGDVSPDGKTLALITSENGKLALMDVASKKVSKTMVVDEKEVTGVAFSNDGATIATLSKKDYSKGNLRFWNASTGEMKSEIVTNANDGSLRYSPGGTILATIGQEVTLQNPNGVAGSHSLLFALRNFVDLSFSPDGTMFAAVNNDHDYISIVDIYRGGKPTDPPADNKEKKELPPEIAKLKEAYHDLPYAFGPNNELAYFADKYEKVVREVDLKSGEEKRAFAGHPAYIESVAVSPNGKSLAAGGNNGLVCLFDLEKGELQHTAMANEGEVKLLRFSPNSEYLLSTGVYDWAVSLWKIGEDQPKYLQEKRGLEYNTSRYAPKLNVTNAIFSPDSSLVIVAFADRHLRAYQTADQKKVAQVKAVSAQNFSLQPAENGKSFFTRTRDLMLEWQIDDMQQSAAAIRTDVVRSHPPTVRDAILVGEYNGLLKRLGGADQTKYVAFSADETVAAVLKFGGEVDVWDMAAVAEEIKGRKDQARVTFDYVDRSLNKHRITAFAAAESGEAQGVAVSPDGSKILTVASKKSEIALWNATTGEKIKAFAPTESFCDVASSPQSTIVAVTGSQEKSVRLFDFSTDEELPAIAVEAADTVCFSPDGGTLYISGDTVLLYDPKTGQKKGELPIRGAESLGISPDGETIAVRKFGTIAACDAKTGKQRWETPPQSAGREYAKFTPNGKYVVSHTMYNGSEAPQFFDATTGKLLRTIEGAGISGETVPMQSSPWLAKTGEAFYIDSIESILNDEVQQFISSLNYRLDSVWRDGEYYVFETNLQGRLSLDLLMQLKDFPHPYKVRAWYCEALSDHTLAKLKDHQQLRGLVFDADNTTDKGAAALAELTNLEEVSVGYASPAMLKSVFGLPNLQVVTIESYEVEDTETQAWQALAEAKSLQYVNIGLAEDHQEKIIDSLSQLPKLTKLTLRFSDDISPTVIEKIAAMSQLKDITVSFSESKELLAAISKLPKLKRLKIDNREFTDDDLDILSTSPSIEYLDLNTTGVAANAEAILEMKNLKAVRYNKFEAKELVEKLKAKSSKLRLIE